jgi:hypothetical protein
LSRAVAHPIAATKEALVAKFKPTKSTKPKISRARPVKASKAADTEPAGSATRRGLPAEPLKEGAIAARQRRSAEKPQRSRDADFAVEPGEHAGPRPKVSLDAGKKREVIAILSVGCSRTTAAQYVGCHASTISRTATRDPEFDQDVRHAESLLELKHLKNIDAAAKDARYWRAAAWALERKYPDRWGPRRPHALSAEQVSQALEQFAQLVVDEVSEADTRDRILKRLDDFAAELTDTGNQAALDET